MIQSTQALFSTIREALDAILAGRPVIVLDSEDRENEGDFVMAAELISAEIIHFLMTQGRGQICVPVLPELANRLGFSRMVAEPTDANSPGFAIPVDHISGATGVSPEDRTLTIRGIVDPQSRDDDFVRPGHTFPLIARPGGVLARPGHTEATIDLLLMAGMQPIGTLCEICSRDGRGMAQRDELLQLSAEFELPIITVDAVIAARRVANRARNSKVGSKSIRMDGSHADEAQTLHSRGMQLFRSAAEKSGRQPVPGEAKVHFPDVEATLYENDSEVSPIEAEWMERYAAVGRRNAYMWAWTRRGIEAMAVSCLDLDLRESVGSTKFLGVMLVVLLDDVADEHGSTEFSKRLLSIPVAEQPLDFSSFSDEEQQQAALCVELWQEIEGRVCEYPRYDEFACILKYDYQQLLNAMQYASLIKLHPELLNLAEHDLYLPHNMYMMVLSTLDLMCSPDFDRDEIGKLREAIWHAQWMGRIGNLITTWQRELGEDDYSSGVFARAISQGDITVPMLRARDREQLQAAIKSGTHEQFFNSKWWEHRQWLLAQKAQMRSVDLGEMVRGLDTLIQLDLQLARLGSKAAAECSAG